ELVQEEGIAKGGSFYHYLDSCKISVDIPYTEPEAWLGFRCVCEEIKGDTNLIASDFLNFQYTVKPEFDTTNMTFSLLPVIPDTVDRKFNIRLNDFKKVTRITELVSMNPEDTITGYEVVFFEHMGYSLTSDYSITETLTPLTQDFIKNMKPNATFVILINSINGKQIEDNLIKSVLLRIY
ncbi:MAG: hypothetical protein H7Y00_01160, partial [Fimbriimonadaceae bacterium]|nr:hypothetical protein [Chitinophagales bacterium]